MSNWSWATSVPGTPIPQARVVPSRTTRRGQVIPAHHTPRSRRYRDLLVLEFRRRKPTEPVDFPVCVTIAVMLRRRRSATRPVYTPASCRAYPVHPGSGDVDNYAKQVLDALVTAGVLADDRYVVALTVRKLWTYSGPAALFVKVEQL